MLIILLQSPINRITCLAIMWPPANSLQPDLPNISREKKCLDFFYRAKQSPLSPASPSKLSQSKIFVETSQSGDLFAFKTTAAGVIDIFSPVSTQFLNKLKGSVISSGVKALLGLSYLSITEKRPNTTFFCK